MSTINFHGNFLGPVPETTDEYLLRVSLGDHQPVLVVADEEMAEVYPLIVDARPLSALSEEPRQAFIKIKCPKLKAIALVVRDNDDPQSSHHEEIEPRPFSEEDSVPEHIHVFYDLSPESVDSVVVGETYRILPGRRTRTIHH